ncbi:hypothetical protein K458DRAFT_392073 [Lentithecium fluviatile CBS 122367]|uniref:Uncharacterized protein n=1 Tax=Lentithecium fluviatile CBS 122367 TaxID=1168545 RepID=A0A6G1ISS3_9PLEO|nr:hypothetical protein K458DRAFT_392073 [Lentithecium fluviatile CBS 122367]
MATNSSTTQGRRESDQTSIMPTASTDAQDRLQQLTPPGTSKPYPDITDKRLPAILHGYLGPDRDSLGRPRNREAVSEERISVLRQPSALTHGPIQPEDRSSSKTKGQLSRRRGVRPDAIIHFTSHGEEPMVSIGGDVDEETAEEEGGPTLSYPGPARFETDVTDWVDWDAVFPHEPEVGITEHRGILKPASDDPIDGDDCGSVASSYAASVFSVESLAPSATNLSEGSGYSSYQIATATKELLNIIQRDDVLVPLYRMQSNIPALGQRDSNGI